MPRWLQTPRASRLGGLCSLSRLLTPSCRAGMSREDLHSTCVDRRGAFATASACTHHARSRVRQRPIRVLYVARSERLRPDFELRPSRDRSDFASHAFSREWDAKPAPFHRMGLVTLSRSPAFTCYFSPPLEDGIPSLSRSGDPLRSKETRCPCPTCATDFQFEHPRAARFSRPSRDPGFPASTVVRPAPSRFLRGTADAEPTPPKPSDPNLE